MALSGVLASKASSTYPDREKSCLGSSGWEGENWYASGASVDSALLDNVLSSLAVKANQ
jgi:hypothetical protein